MSIRICKGGLIGLLVVATQATVTAWESQDISEQIADVMSQGASGKAHQRFTHAKGIVCQGAFVPSRDAVALSRAAHFQGGKVPITVRFSNGAPDIAIPDNSSDAAPRGISIRFKPRDRARTSSRFRGTDSSSGLAQSSCGCRRLSLRLIGRSRIPGL
jgi:hypothetical protein